MEQVKHTAGILAVLLFLAGTAWADGGSVSGAVRVGKEPGAFAHVRIPGTRRGAQADENGHYLITNLPAGRYAIEALLVGFETVTETVTVREGRTTQLDFKLPVPEPPQPPKDWHPPAPPSKVLLDRMMHADTVRVLRVSGVGPNPRWSTYTISAWRVLPSRNAHSFVKLLRQRESFDAGFQPGEVKLCIPKPDVLVQFEDDDGMVNVFLCYGCEMLWVVVPGEGMVGGDFDRRRGEFVSWLKQAWPAEPPAQELPGSKSR